MSDLSLKPSSKSRNNWCEHIFKNYRRHAACLENYRAVLIFQQKEKLSNWFTPPSKYHWQVFCCSSLTVSKIFVLAFKFYWEFYQPMWYVRFNFCALSSQCQWLVVVKLYSLIQYLQHPLSWYNNHPLIAWNILVDHHFTFAELEGIKYLKLTNLFYIYIDSQHDLFNFINYTIHCYFGTLMNLLQKVSFADELPNQRILHKNIIRWVVTEKYLYKYAKCQVIIKNNIIPSNLPKFMLDRTTDIKLKAWW